MVTRKDKLVDNFISEYINTYTRYSPDDLINIANKMKNDGITAVEINSSYDSTNIDYFRLETEEEAIQREDKAKIEKQRILVNQEYYLRENAEKLGYKLVKKEE